MKQLQLPVTKKEPYSVTLGTGSSVQGKGVCRGVVLQLLEGEIIEEFLLLELGSADAILGVQWLEKLGTI